MKTKETQKENNQASREQDTSNLAELETTRLKTAEVSLPKKPDFMPPKKTISLQRKSGIVLPQNNSISSPEKEIFHIAIDGPVASGKGTIARGLSNRLGIPCLDTGAMYRGLAVYLRDNNYDAKSAQAVTDALQGVKMSVEIKNGITSVKINGTDVTSKLRDNDISQATSIIATYSEVRKFLTKKQQEIAKTQSFILEGRDISSVVLPDAKYKFYLTAKVKTRAERRKSDLAEKGIQITIKEMIEQIKERDRRDMKKGGLKQVRAAIEVDNTRLSVEETIHEFMTYIK